LARHADLERLVFLRQPLGRLVGWCLPCWTASRARSAGASARIAAAAFVLAGLALVGVVGLLLTNIRQLTSEIGRLWLIVGAAWFFFLRARRSPNASRDAAARSSRSSTTSGPCSSSCWS